MGWGGWKKIGSSVRKVGSAVSTTLSPDLIYNPAKVTGQWGDIGQSMTSDARGALAQNVPGYAGAEKWVGSHQRELYTVAAALGGLGLAQGAANMGAAHAAYATGGLTAAAIGGEALRHDQITRKLDADQRDIPPDLRDMYKNDANMAMQFARARKAAKMLGRGGTFKAKGAASLGSEQGLGSNLALEGS